MRLIKWCVFVMAGAILLAIFSFGFDALWDQCVAIGGTKGFIITETIFAVIPSLTFILLLHQWRACDEGDANEAQED